MRAGRYDAVVIGGGAAGLLCAGTAARRGLSVLVVEGRERPARKILVTGKGRCNLTNNCPVEELLENVCSNAKFLYSGFYSFTAQDVMEFFEKAGMPVKTERGNRVFPVSDRAFDVSGALEKRMRQLGVRLVRDRAEALLIHDGSLRGVRTAGGDLEAAKVIVATGGVSYPLTGSTGDGYRLAEQAGHTVKPTFPALVPLVLQETWCRELQGLVDVLAKHPHVMVLSDEIYEHINYIGGVTSMGSFPEIADRVILVNGVSKAYAMTGWRVGFMAGPVEVAKAVTKLQGQTTSGISTIAQRAALAAYEGSQQCVEDMRLAFERRRDLVVGLAREIPGLKVNRPDGAFYLFPEVSAYLGKRFGDKVIADDNDLCMYLLEQAHVATVSGSAFCLPGYIRLSYAASDDSLVEAFKRIAQALSRLS